MNWHIFFALIYCWTGLLLILAGVADAKNSDDPAGMRVASFVIIFGILLFATGGGLL